MPYNINLLGSQRDTQLDIFQVPLMVCKIYILKLNMLLEIVDLNKGALTFLILVFVCVFYFNTF